LQPEWDFGINNLTRLARSYLTSSALVTSPPSYQGVFFVRNCAVDAVPAL
jgi:hypothetical protein